MLNYLDWDFSPEQQMIQGVVREFVEREALPVIPACFEKGEFPHALVPRLGELFPERRLIAGLLVASSIAVAALAAVGSVWPYGGLRFVQVLSIAPVFPLVVSRVIQHAGGSAIGVINAARIGAGFIGPVAATSLLAWTSPAVVYLLLASIGLACVPLVRMREAGART